MGFGRAVSKAARKGARGLQGNRNSQGDLRIDATNPNEALKSQAFQMEDADLETLAAQLGTEIKKGDEAQAVILQERLDIVNDVIASRADVDPLSVDVKF